MANTSSVQNSGVPAGRSTSIESVVLFGTVHEYTDIVHSGYGGGPVLACISWRPRRGKARRT